MVIRATTKIMMKVTVTPTKADVSTHSDEFKSGLPSKLITTSSPGFPLLLKVGRDSSSSSSSSSSGNSLPAGVWISLGAKTLK